MSTKDIEIELRFPLLNFLSVKNFLDQNAQKIASDLFQRDSYFSPRHRDFLNFRFPYEWLRIRETNQKNSICYKHFYPENVEKTDYCDEFESELTNAEAIRKLFKSLDFNEIVVVEKNREIWLFDDVEIAVDDVKTLGQFIELEAKKFINTPQETKQYLYGVLKKINATVGEEDIRGYPFKILKNKGYNF